MLVVQAEAFNRSRIRTVLAVILTSNLRLLDAPGNVLLPAKASGLPRDSVVNVSQIVTLDRTSAEGDLWVRRWWADTEPGSRFDVYSPDGRLRGTVTIDARIEPPIAVRGDRLYAVVRDELGVASVTVRRVSGLD